MAEKKYRILEVCVDLDGGGIDRYLYNYCTRINEIQFDFAAVDNKHGILEERIKNHGCLIFKVPRLSNGFIQNYNALKTIMKQHHYDAVHVHLGFYGFIALKAAKECGIKTRIVHAHIAFVPETIKDKIIRKVLTAFTKYYATNLAACGIDSAKWVWGEKNYVNGKVIIHNNAIDTSIYQYSEKKRIEVRRKLGISDNTIIVGHVGRLCEQKNQKRLIEIFDEFVKCTADSKLLLIGYKELNYDISSLISHYKLNDKVLVLGVRNDVPELLNAMDVFVFPSKFEGLPFTLIETQCNGLYSLSSDSVSKFAKVSTCVDFLSLSATNREWALKALVLSGMKHNAYAIDSVRSEGYDLDIESYRLKEYYISLITKNG